MPRDTLIIEAANPCYLTGSREAVVVADKDRHGKPLRTVISTASGLVYTDPRPSHEDMLTFYRQEYRLQYKGTFTPRPKHVYRAGRSALSRYARFDRHLRPGSRILEIGSGGGEFQYLMKTRGMEATGIEPNEGYAEYSINELGVDVRVGGYEEMDFPEAHFDVITSFHVVEHLVHPGDAFRTLSRYLKDDGLLVIEVPNVTCAGSFPATMWHIGHLFNFNRDTLAATAVQGGFDVVSLNGKENEGNLFGIFIKRPRKESWSLEGNFERVRDFLNGHTRERHLLTAVPYIRPFHKASRSIREKWAVRRIHSGGRNILDALYDGKA